MPQSWRPVVSQQALDQMAAELPAFVASCEHPGAWEEIGLAPWFRHRGPKDSPAQLSQTDLSGLNLRGIVLPCANLRLTWCVNQDLREARLNGSLLREGIFTGSKFCRASLCNADLTDADLSRCDLSGVDFEGALLRNVNLAGARVDWSRIGIGRWRVSWEYETASGELGEMVQPRSWSVRDQKTGRELERFHGTIETTAYGSDGPIESGIVDVRISDDGKSIMARNADGKMKALPLPA